MKLIEFPSCDAPEVFGQATSGRLGVLAVVDVLGCGVAKSLNHFYKVAEYRFTSNDKLRAATKLTSNSPLSPQVEDFRTSFRPRYLGNFLVWRARED